MPIRKHSLFFFGGGREGENGVEHVVIFSQMFSMLPLCQRAQCITLNLTVLTLTRFEHLANNLYSGTM